MNASCGISTEPTDFIRFLPAFVFQVIYVYERYRHRNILLKHPLRQAFTVSRATIFVPTAA